MSSPPSTPSLAVEEAADAPFHHLLQQIHSNTLVHFDWRGHVSSYSKFWQSSWNNKSENYDLQPRDVADLCQALKNNTSVTQFIIGCNHLTVSDLAPIFQLLLTKMEITSCGLYCDHLDDDMAGAWAEALEHNVHMYTFSMWGNSVSKNGLAALCHAWKANRSLMNLLLRGHRLDVQQYKQLGDMLKSNDHITDLSLFDNRMNDDGCVALCDGIKHNRSLNHLRLWFNNPIGVKGAKAVLDCARHNGFLKYVDLDGSVDSLIIKKQTVAYWLNEQLEKNKAPASDEQQSKACCVIV